MRVCSAEKLTEGFLESCPHLLLIHRNKQVEGNRSGVSVPFQAWITMTFHTWVTTLKFLKIIFMEDRPHCICSPVSCNSNNISAELLHIVAHDILKFALHAAIILWSLLVILHGGRVPLKLLHGANVSDRCNVMLERLGTPSLEFLKTWLGKTLSKLTPALCERLDQMTFKRSPSTQIFLWF